MAEVYYVRGRLGDRPEVQIGPEHMEPGKQPW